ncbi:NUDIX hydrolase [Flavobacterium sp. CYK-4]|uniref:NUDIX domain-containing protein n=1 Tax=Flavobacterium lotistagni TaxID=2709660 RepID=UPI00140D6D5B|nr:NUDIX hydrolase [Flavobacterium lotistagni]NHM06882.1 NUDIX hydrolase [Flavobacterium lotistagni]
MRTSKIFVTVDMVIFKILESKLYVLLIQRKKPPFEDFWALPGGFVYENEALEDAAKRELFEETNIQTDNLEQIGVFGKPFRDPRGHVISIAYQGFVTPTVVAVANDDAMNAQWFAIDDLPEMAFDHAEIITLAQTKYLN